MGCTLASLMGNPPQHSHLAGRYAPDTKTSHTSLKVANGMCMVFHLETANPTRNLQGWVGNMHTVLCHLTQAPRLSCSCQPAPSPSHSYLNTPVIIKNLPPSPWLLPPPFPTPSFQMPKVWLLLWHLQPFSLSEHCQYETLWLHSNLCGSIK